MNWYLGISGLIFTLLFLIWSKKSRLDIMIKFGLFLMAAWSTFLNLQALGYVVKL